MRIACRLAFVLVAAACASNEDSGAAGAPAGPLGIGDVCAGGLECKSGLVCSRAVFRDQCSVQCAIDNGCQVLDGRTRCLGGPPAECGIACTSTGDCPEGTTCVSLSGGMACKIP